ncbi:MAG TPA: class I adenylate-forming enzyme family protein [Thermoanaerobaculia bacterium]|nr:class I adenylate-forming enzyme family protein [Thermoanaerobaculia bacterium]
MLERFTALVHADPGAVALIDGQSGEVTSRAALLARAEELATELKTAGMREGELLAVQLPNSVDFVAAFAAALQLKLVVVPMDRDAPESEVAKILRHFSIRGLLSGAAGSQPVVAVRRAESPSLQMARLIKLTSGSTGVPKGIVTTEANLIADCENICATMGIQPTDLNLGAIPFSHSYGFSNLVTPLLLQGTPVVFSNDYLPQSLIELVNRFRCTVAPLIPMVFAHLATAAHGAFESVRTFISAGAPLPPSTSRRFRERFGIDIHSFYGCSECGGITYDRLGGAVERGTVGSALENVEVIGDEKRLAVRSASVAAGYLFDAKTFEPFVNATFTTDDLVEVRDGEIALIGRASDLINTAGKKVNPREVEAVILQIEGVREAKVYGEAAGARGEVVAAAIVAMPYVTRELVREYCRARLSLHKVPRIVKLIDELPVDERGKVKRAALAML